MQGVRWPSIRPRAAIGENRDLSTTLSRLRGKIQSNNPTFHDSYTLNYPEIVGTVSPLNLLSCIYRWKKKKPHPKRVEAFFVEQPPQGNTSRTVPKRPCKMNALPDTQGGRGGTRALSMPCVLRPVSCVLRRQGNTSRTVPKRTCRMNALPDTSGGRGVPLCSAYCVPVLCPASCVLHRSHHTRLPGIQTVR